MIKTSSPSVTLDRPTVAQVGWQLVTAALGFVLLYLGVDLVLSGVASSPLPLPDASIADVRTWYVDNQLASALVGACQFLSVTCLAVFVVRLRHTVAAGGRLAAAGLVSVAMMVLSCALSWVLTAVAADASDGVVTALRTANFVAGGTAHVFALGAFVLLCTRITGMSKPVRVFGCVAAVPALASVVSLVWFQGAALILLGRLLCMAWTVTVALSMARRKSVPTRR